MMVLGDEYLQPTVFELYFIKCSRVHEQLYLLVLRSGPITLTVRQKKAQTRQMGFNSAFNPYSANVENRVIS
jgi:hypothetical protein